LEPSIDAATMGFHHDKHHAAYVNNLNKALESHPELQGKDLFALLADLDSVPGDIRTAVRNNGGGHANHSLFWKIMTAGGSAMPSGKLGEDIAATFGSFESFKDQFTKAAMGVFGSGWAWLSVTGDGKLTISTTPNQDNPISSDMIPILGLDVWEHAYYLKYQNVRADYVAAWWNVVDWRAVADNYGSIQLAMGVANFVERVKATWEKIFG
jgi:Fe-Mn family superoxide dismutase